MKPAPTLHGADRSRSARHWSSALLTIAIAGLLNACGGSASEAGTSGVSPATCITGTAPAALTWDAVTGATGYRIHYGIATGTYSQNLNVGNLTTTTVMGLSKGTTYYFTVTAYDNSNPVNESGFSNEVCKTIS